MVPPQGRVIIIQAEAEIRPAAALGNNASASVPAVRPATQIRHAAPSAEDIVRESSHQGLTFHVENGSVAQDDALEALASIAQVTAPCYTSC